MINIPKNLKRFLISHLYYEQSWCESMSRDKRKIMRIGGGSYAITLPKSWVRGVKHDLGIKDVSNIEVTLEFNGDIRIKRPEGVINE